MKCVDGDTFSWVVNGADVAVVCTDGAFALRVCESRIHRDLAILQYMYIRMYVYIYIYVHVLCNIIWGLHEVCVCVVLPS